MAFSNEVAETFRYFKPELLKPLYIVSFGYIGIDIFHSILFNKNHGFKTMFYAGLDGAIFHGFASILLPGVAIHSIVAITK